MKKVLKVAAIMLVIAFVMSFSAFAAPNSLALDVSGNASGILTVTNPAAATISSYDRLHNFSGYAATGAEVSVYSSYGGRYNLVKSCTVGASGLFVQPVSLNKGRNDLVIRAEINGQVQYVKRTVNVLSISFFNLLKGFNLY